MLGRQRAQKILQKIEPNRLLGTSLERQAEVRELGKLDMKVYDDHLTERLHVRCGD